MATIGRERVIRNRTIINEARSRPCEDCGLVEPAIMDLDHARGSKVANVSRMVHATLAQLRVEMEKCDTVCPNCHRRRTLRRLAVAERG